MQVASQKLLTIIIGINEAFTNHKKNSLHIYMDAHRGSVALG